MCTFQGHLFWNCGDQWPSQKCFNHLQIWCIFQYRSMCCCCKAMTFTTWNTNSQQDQQASLPTQKNKKERKYCSNKRPKYIKTSKSLTKSLVTSSFLRFVSFFSFAWAHLPCQNIISQQLFETGCKNDTNFLALDLFSMVGAEQQWDDLNWEH